MTTVKITHFSDLLCIWAYVGEVNVHRLAESFGDAVSIDTRYCSVFPDTHTKINRAWADRGGFDGYASHVREVAEKFDVGPLHDNVWTSSRPRSSASPHLFLKALDLIEQESATAGKPFAERPQVRAAKTLRAAFFKEGRDISDWSVQREISAQSGVPFDAVLARIETGEAIAHLAMDYDMARSSDVRGSPTYLMNDGRQRLFGNVGYGILLANINELMMDTRDEKASTPD